MADEPHTGLADPERAGVAEAERPVAEAEFGAHDLSGRSFLLAGGLALARTAFQLWTAAAGAIRPRRSSSSIPQFAT